VLGVGGIVAFVLGSLLLFDTPESTIAVERSIVATAVLTMSGFMLAVGYLVLRSQRRRATTGTEGLVGEIGVVRERNRSRREDLRARRALDAVSDTPLDVGERIEVVRVEKGMRLRVRRAAAREHGQG